MTVVDCYVFRSPDNCETAVMFSPRTLYLKTGLQVSNLNILAISFVKLMKEITSCMAVDSTIYSFLVVYSVLSVCILFPNVMGHPAYTITQPILETTDSCAALSPSLHPPEISAFTQHSNPLDRSGLKIIPLSWVSSKHIIIFLTTLSQESLGSLLNLAHQ